MALDPGLLAAVREGRAIPFLGAGASYGAKALDGSTIPLGDQLKRMVAKRFLDGDFEEASFATVCDFAASVSDERQLQQFFHETLNPYGPADYHLLFPTFRWAGIATTNYDLIVERAYERAEPAQKLATLCMDKDQTIQQLGSQSVLYNKLHGCITHYQEVHPPLVASTEQLVNHIDGRAQQFAQFLEWGKTKTLIFVGYGMGDPNLRALVEALKREGDKRPRHYLVRPKISRIEQDYWHDRRIVALDMTFEEFLRSLDVEISFAARKLSAVSAANVETSLTRFIAYSGRQESEGLKEYLRTRCEHVSDSLAGTLGTASKFYQGFDLGWYPIEAGLDVHRRVASDIITEQVAATSALTGPRFVLVKSHAGGGKSVLLRRVAWNAFINHDRLVFFVRDAAAVDVDAFEEISSLVNQTIYLIVDDVTDGHERIEQLLNWAKSNSVPIVVIAGARYNEWNIRCEYLSTRLYENYDLKYLSAPEIDELIHLLGVHECLGSLSDLSLEEQRQRLRDVYGRQLLVALHEATKNKSFEEIIADEYAGIFPPEAQILYRDVCAVNRFGPPVRAGLIARVHGIAFEEFHERFFAPLEEVVDARFDSRVRDNVYVARHPFIAEMVYKVALPTAIERLDNILSIVGKLNPAYSYDGEVMASLVRGNALAELFPDPTMGSKIYDTVSESLGEDHFILHQRAIYEMRLAGDMGGLDRAQGYLERALELRPGSPAIKHSLAEISLKRAGVARDPLERDAWLRQSESAAQRLTKTQSSSHPYHTLAKVAIAELKDAMIRASEGDEDELRNEALSQAIKKAEEAIRSGLQKFPNDDRLLTEEAALNELLEKADKVLPPLKRAFLANPKSELIGRRLARVLVAKGQAEEAVTVVRQGLDHNPGSQSLHFAMAQAIRAIRPDADDVSGDDLLFHLYRSFTRGDRNYDAQFWYARQLALSNDPSSAKDYFVRLKKLPFTFEQRRTPRGAVFAANGEKKVFYGAVTMREASFGFIRTDGTGLDVFFRPNDGDDAFVLGKRVSFNLEFNLAGPIATTVKLT